MTLARFREAWERFFFAPQSPEPIAVFRILYGTCVSITLILLHSEWLDWFGVHSWVTLNYGKSRARCSAEPVYGDAAE